ncbi:MAG: hydrolase TatD [Planctomycetota bacterium]|nr:MAG: hydrolase TatD [Planctomycetota bacterium]
MKIIDTHMHTMARTTDDLERMATAGIAVVVEPAFWPGSNRRHAESFFDYFRHIEGFEAKRVGEYGIRHYCAIGINPKEVDDLGLASAVIERMEEFIALPTALGVGEIGFDRITPTEDKVFCMQMEVAKRLDCPVIIHTPHFNKLNGVRRSLEIIKETGVKEERVIVDHNTEDTIAETKKHNVWAGFTMYPITKMTPARTVAILKEYGLERMLINSSADWGPSDPLAVPKAVALMRREGFSEEDIKKVVFDNPVEFFSQSPKFKI